MLAEYLVACYVYDRNTLWLKRFLKGQFCFFFFTLSSSSVLNASIFTIRFHSRTSPRWNFTLDILKAGTFSFLSTKQCEKQSWGWGSDPVGCRYPDNRANAHIETRTSRTDCVPLMPEFIWSKPLLCGWWYRWLLVFPGVTAREKRERCKSFHQTRTDQMGLFEACVFIVMRNEDSQIKNNSTSLSSVPGKFLLLSRDEMISFSKTNC